MAQAFGSSVADRSDKYHNEPLVCTESILIIAGQAVALRPAHHASRAIELLQGGALHRPPEVVDLKRLPYSRLAVDIGLEVALERLARLRLNKQH